MYMWVVCLQREDDASCTLCPEEAEERRGDRKLARPLGEQKAKEGAGGRGKGGGRENEGERESEAGRRAGQTKRGRVGLREFGGDSAIRGAAVRRDSGYHAVAYKSFLTHYPYYRISSLSLSLYNLTPLVSILAVNKTSCDSAVETRVQRDEASFPKIK